MAGDERMSGTSKELLARMYRLGFTEQQVEDVRFELREKRVAESLLNERASDEQLLAFVPRVLVAHDQEWRTALPRPGFHRDDRRPGDTHVTRTQGGAPGLGRRS